MHFSRGIYHTHMHNGISLKKHIYHLLGACFDALPPSILLHQYILSYWISGSRYKNVMFYETNEVDSGISNEDSVPCNILLFSTIKQ